MNSKDKITAAKVQLVSSAIGAFWGPLVSRLRIKEVPMGWNGCWAMATDGTNLYYVDETIQKWPMSTLVAVVAHEVMHCAQLHPYRMIARLAQGWDQQFANYCQDLVINKLLQNSGFVLPPEAALRPDVDGNSETWEAVYMRLSQDKQLMQKYGGSGDGSGGGQGGSQGWAIGGVLDPTKTGATDENGQPVSEAGAKRQEQDWSAAMAGAVDILAKRLGRGNVPGWMELQLGQIMSPKVDWRSKLWELFSSWADKEQTWSRPNRNHLPRGMYLPGSIKEPAMGTLEIWVDTSGSMLGLLDEVAAELRGILAALQPREVVVGYIDAAVERVDRYSQDELDSFEIHMVGGGGTSFVPAFEWADREVVPEHMIYITDLDGTFPDKEPNWPTTWVHIDGYGGSYGGGRVPKVPFGNVIPVQ